MFDKYRKTLVAGTVAITLGLSASGVMAAGFKPAPPAGQTRCGHCRSLRQCTTDRFG